ncbi:CHASE4 domain-containing protein [Alkalinema sp. FACHB-956]|uniref:CHASE4 domain-containing protein n=1 Tax=Alkalinema sp. FACHB-956 TaxID=2692768 RepID=UPI001685CAD3|nr:CHASE4 domain-containing protein [Alkalinema sp. FACHB-956]MBD2327519.1 response regulator [Alkalinema sp. FACHB-956]
MKPIRLSSKSPSLSLRRKTLGMIGITLVGLNVTLFLIFSSLLLRNAQQADHRQAQHDIEIASQFVDHTLEEISDRFSDWSSWDDTYNYMQTRDPGFIESNLIDSQLALLDVNLIAFFSPTGELVFGTMYDSKKARSEPIPPEILKALTPTSPILKPPSQQEDLTGLIQAPEGAMLLASRPILNSKRQGPVRGRMVIGKYFHNSHFLAYSKMLRLPLQSHSIVNGEFPKELKHIQFKPQDPVTVDVHEASSKIIHAHTVLKDFFGNPVLALTLDNPRSAYQQGWQTLYSLMGLSILVGLVFGGMTVLNLEKLVLARLSRLNKEVKNISQLRRLDQRVTDLGTDELGNLSRTLNRMLNALEQYEQEQHQAAADILHAKEEAEAASRAKSQFLANMSHELRTPMNAIIGFSEMLMEDAAQAHKTDLFQDLETIHNAGNHLLRLINDILDISKIEAGKMELYLEKFPVLSLVQSTIETIQPLLQNNANHLVTHLSPDLGEMYADAVKVRQILYNLLSNACKFTHNGTISLSVDPIPESQSIRFRVIDSGIGLSQEQIGQLFQAFSQADSSTTRKYGGTGLGLTITQHFCTMMGGTISVESTLNEGSTFEVLLPQQVSALQPSEPPLIQQPRTPFKAQNLPLLLVIDDDPNFHELIRRQLTSYPLQIVDAMTAEEGIQIAKTMKPQVITLDVMMPNQDGWSVLMTLKQDPELAQIPVIMTTIVENPRLGYSLGATDYLLKPVSRERLQSTLEKYCPPDNADYGKAISPDRVSEEIYKLLFG